MSASPRLFIKRFYSKFKPDRQDPSRMVEEHWVEYGPIGSLDKSSTSIKVLALKPREPLSMGNPSSEMGWMRWQIIEAAYERWLSGQEAPVEGTPLAAWNALSPEQAEVLRHRGIRTVEEVSQLTDAHVERIPLPMRELIRQAKQFLDAADANRTSAALAEKDQQIEALKASEAELRDQVASLLTKVDQLADLVAQSHQASAAKVPSKKKAA